MNHLTKVAAVALGAVMVVSCSSDPDVADEAVVAISDVAHVQLTPQEAPAFDTVVENCNSMGLESLSAVGDENLVFSPLSWCMALGMLNHGTTNQAQDEVAQAFGADAEDVSSALNALAGELAAFEADPASVEDDDLPEEPVVHRATNVVLREGFEPLDSYLDPVKEYYDSGVMLADLGSPEGKAVLDAWVNHHTGGRVEESAIEPDPDLVMVLQDALLFAAQWDAPFLPAEAVDFTNADGNEVTPEGFGDLRSLDHAEVDGWQAVRIPFTSDFSTLFVLPPEGETGLTPELRAELVAALEPMLVDFQAPKLSLETKLDLLELMDLYGIASLLDDSTLPLEGILPDEGLRVGQAFQQATLEVTETGAVAAAVTEIGVMESSAPEPGATLHLDRPFYLLITHDETGTDLFQAAVRTLE